MSDDLSGVLTAVGPRLRALRQESGMTLARLGELTGISVSTLSRLESGGRKPTLELLLPLARAHGVQLDELVGTRAAEDPRIHPKPFNLHGTTFIPLTRYLGGMRAYKQIYPPLDPDAPLPELRSHEGYDWLYVLSGRLRLRLGEHDMELRAGEAAEFDTRVPHAMSNAGTRPLEVLGLFGPQGERLHVRARPAGRAAAGDEDAEAH
ncbi:helix-turn-helix domain-containing protein [Streptomyces sp. NPDC059740]|uniref:helix-turn-helix domain-containing protein n=1 Tax=Streptomyces sp. NPDC059740 TaxID=3346926 RepID=UPI003663C459